MYGQSSRDTGAAWGHNLMLFALRRRVQWWIIHEFGVADEGIRKSAVPWHSVGAVFWDIPCGSDDELVGIGLYARKTICYAESRRGCSQARTDQPTDDRTVSLRCDSWTIYIFSEYVWCNARCPIPVMLTKSIRTSARHSTGAIHVNDETVQHFNHCCFLKGDECWETNIP